MKDEEYVFRQEVKDKSFTARSARNKRTHNGKSGRVKLPSDYMTKKELNAMNGEVKSYRLNEPMSWKEFKAMPDDIKVTYVKLLREKFGVPDTYLAKMFGVSQCAARNVIVSLGINIGKTRSGRTHWDKEGWLAWCNGVPASVPAETLDPVPAEELDGVATEEEIAPIVVKEEAVREQTRAIPAVGNMVFEGKVEDILKTVEVLLGGVSVRINITWDVL